MDQMKILLVDDSKSARYALRLQLQRHGVEVETADSAESAFEILKGELPDAILMDHMMPGLNGFEALEAIRLDARTAHLPVVMCTSHEDADFAATAQRKGVVGILPKSVAPEKLPEILERLRTAVAAAEAPTVPTTAPSVPAPAQRRDVARDSGDSGRAGGSRGPETDRGARGRAHRAPARGPAGSLARRPASRPQRAGARGYPGADRVPPLRDTPSTRGQACRRAHGPGLGRSAKDIKELEGLTGPGGGEHRFRHIVKVEIEAERSEILGLVEQYLKELSPQAQATDLGTERLAALDGAIASKAQNAAQRAAQDAIEAGIDRTNRIADAMVNRVRASMRLVYLAIAGAGLVGALSSAAVFFMVR